LAVAKRAETPLAWSTYRDFRATREISSHLVHEGRHEHRMVAAEIDARLLPRDRDAELALARVVRDDRAADPVLELRDHLARAVVRARIRTEEDEDVEVEAHRVAADLDVALLEDVEEPDLHELVEVGELVHREDAAVLPRDEAEVERLLGRHRGTRHEARGVDLADHIGELGAGREALGVAIGPVPPRDADLLGRGGGEEFTTRARDRALGVLVDGAGGDIEVRDPRVEEPRQEPHEAALALALFAEEEHVMAGEDCVDHFGEHRVVVAEDAGEELAGRGARRGECRDEVCAEFVLHGARAPAGGAEFGEGADRRAGGIGGRHGVIFAGRAPRESAQHPDWCQTVHGTCQSVPGTAWHVPCTVPNLSRREREEPSATRSGSFARGGPRCLARAVLCQALGGTCRAPSGTVWH